jgi:hypothetical protein
MSFAFLAASSIGESSGKTTQQQASVKGHFDLKARTGPEICLFRSPERMIVPNTIC